MANGLVLEEAALDVVGGHEQLAVGDDILELERSGVQQQNVSVLADVNVTLALEFQEPGRVGRHQGHDAFQRPLVLKVHAAQQAQLAQCVRSAIPQQIAVSVELGHGPEGVGGDRGVVERESLLEQVRQGLDRLDGACCVVHVAARLDPPAPVGDELLRPVHVGRQELRDGDITLSQRLAERRKHASAGPHVAVHEAALVGEHPADAALAGELDDLLRRRLGPAVVRDCNLADADHVLQKAEVSAHSACDSRRWALV
mmetsp:Transcript_9746/g.22353  ORF Transcript_9746/g.22353 Transcript_9746/m.22353 type:complete len:257 (-) Transcript_9746:3511-4281(-)